MMRPMPGSFHQPTTSHHSRAWASNIETTPPTESRLMHAQQPLTSPSRIPRPLSTVSKRRPISRVSTIDSTYSSAEATSDYNGNLGALAANRKRGRQEDTEATDFDDENYSSSQRMSKSAYNGRPSVHNPSITGAYVDDADSEVEDATMKESWFSDREYRRNGGPAPTQVKNLHESDTRGGKRRLLDVVGVVGSVVGAVWEFCKSQAPSLPMLPRFTTAAAEEVYYDTPYNLPPGMFDDGMDMSMTRPTLSIKPPIPYDLDNSTMTDSFTTSSTSRRPSLLACGGADSPMSASWILVAPDATTPSSASTAPMSPRTAASTASMRQNASAPNYGIRPGTPIFTSPPLTQRRTYSRPVPKRRGTGGRGLIIPTSKRSQMLNTTTSSSSASTPVSPLLDSGISARSQSHARRETISGASFASSYQNYEFGMDFPVLTSSTSSLRKGGDRPASSLAGRKRKDEEDEDPNIKRLNLQLKAMIREGREALGAKVEVDEYEDGEEWD